HVAERLDLTGPNSRGPVADALAGIALSQVLLEPPLVGEPRRGAKGSAAPDSEAVAGRPMPTDDGFRTTRTLLGVAAAWLLVRALHGSGLRPADGTKGAPADQP